MASASASMSRCNQPNHRGLLWKGHTASEGSGGRGDSSPSRSTRIGWLTTLTNLLETLAYRRICVALSAVDLTKHDSLPWPLFLRSFGCRPRSDRIGHDVHQTHFVISWLPPRARVPILPQSNILETSAASRTLTIWSGVAHFCRVWTSLEIFPASYPCSMECTSILRAIQITSSFMVLGMQESSLTSIGTLQVLHQLKVKPIP